MTGTSGYPAFASASDKARQKFGCTTSATGLRHQNSRLCHIIFAGKYGIHGSVQSYHQGRIAGIKLFTNESPVLIASRFVLKTPEIVTGGANAGLSDVKVNLDIRGQMIV